MNDDGLAKVISRVLKNAKNIAVVGISPKADRPSHRIAIYLKEQGFSVFPVNPLHKEIGGMKCYPSLSEIPDEIDIVNIFRRSEDIGPIADEAIGKGTKAIWMQSGIVNEDAAVKAREEGIDVVMDHCIKIEHGKRNKS